MTLHSLFTCIRSVSHEALLIFPCPNGHADISRQISEIMLPSLLLYVPPQTRLNSSVPRHSGSHPVDAIRYPQPILILDIRLDNFRCFSNMSRSHTSSTSSRFRQCHHGLGIHRMGFHNRRGSSPFTFYNFEPHNSPLIFCKDAVRIGHSGCVRTRDRGFSPHHYFDSSNISRHISNFYSVGTTTSGTKKNKKKIEKMSDEEAKGLGTPALSPSNKKQSSKKLKK